MIISKATAKGICLALRSYVADITWPEGYADNEAYRNGLAYAETIKEYIKELERKSQEEPELF